MNLPDFITRDDDGFVHLNGHRIGLHHIVAFYNEGFSAEMLLCQFPTLSLALIHKVLGFYLENQSEVDAYVAAEERAIEHLRATTPHGPSLQELRRRLHQMSPS
jgi:uncharacterized protein (DUF433 family)